MGKRHARRKGSGRQAYLKHFGTRYDNNSPFALNKRNNGTINISALVRDPVSKFLVEVDYNSVQTHGKRGLTIARATGPTAVAPHFVGSAPTMVPRAEAQLRRMQLEDKQNNPTTPLRQRVTVAREEWQGLRRQGFTEYHRIVLREFKGQDMQVYYSMELFFSGKRFIFIEENLRTRCQSASIEYSTHDRAMAAFQHDRITWKETIPIPSSHPSPPG